MLGDLAINVLVLLFGYGYPALESFKMLEESSVEIRKLRFWCQYWTIVGIVTVLESFGDMLISWLPMYGEAKLAFFIYLWHPKTRGTIMVYEAFLRPLVTKHEPEIEQKLQQFRAKSGALLLFYLKNFTDKGQSFFLDLLNYFISKPKGVPTKEDKKNANAIMIKHSAQDCAVEPEVLDFLRFAGAAEEAAAMAGGSAARTKNKSKFKLMR